MDDMDFNEGMMPSTNGLADPNEDLLGTSHTNPFDSGFDAEHPFPTYEQLRNAGFSSEVAHNMIDGLDHAYSQKELYHVLYESDDPLTAYNEMMDGKVQETCDKIDELVDGNDHVFSASERIFFIGVAGPAKLESIGCDQKIRHAAQGTGHLQCKTVGIARKKGDQ